MQLSIEVRGLDNIRDNIRELANRAHNTEPLMTELANHLYNISFNSLRDESSPDGISWNPLKPSTLKSKKRNRDSILYEEGDLRGSLRAESSQDSASVGLNATSGGYPYPVVHQFGRVDGTMDARPFMPIHDDDTLYDNVEEELKEIVEDYMREGSLLE